MAIPKSLVFIFVSAVFLIIVRAQSSVDLSPNCLGCICEGSTGCNVTRGCTGGASYFCGPFVISWNYWADAGKPVLDGDDASRKGAFENCVLDIYCAAKTVNGYMSKYGKDCNEDGKIDCEDFIRIHYLGGWTCKDDDFQNTLFYKRYSQCFGVISNAVENSPNSNKP